MKSQPETPFKWQEEERVAELEKQLADLQARGRHDWNSTWLGFRGLGLRV